MGNLIRIAKKDSHHVTRSKKKDISAMECHADIVMFTGVRYKRDEKSEGNKINIPRSPKQKHERG